MRHIPVNKYGVIQESKWGTEKNKIQEWNQVNGDMNSVSHGGQNCQRKETKKQQNVSIYHRGAVAPPA